MEISRATVIANRKKSIARKVKADVEKFLRLRGIGISSKKPQIAITVGGDGTVLFSKKHYGIPFFAIGSRTSFICQATFADWEKKLARALRLFRTESRLLLDCRLGGKRLPLALNEVGIRNPEPRVLSIHLASGRRHFAFRADGMLFSTPTGSPAYAYSCGGRQMGKSEMKYQAVAISPFRRLFSPMDLPAASKCALRIAGPEKAQIFIDGQIVGVFAGGQTLRVQGSARQFLFMKA